MSTEKEIYQYIREKIGEQSCPYIDKSIAVIKDAEKIIDSNSYFLEEKEGRWVYSVLDKMQPIPEYLEKVRGINDELRYSLMKAYCKLSEIGIDYKELD